MHKDYDKPAAEHADPIGENTLKLISEAERFNRWMYNVVERFCSGEILEIGSGTGNLSQFFIEENRAVTLSDLRTPYLERLTERYHTRSNFRGAERIDIAEGDFSDRYASHLNRYDSVIALNVVEHIEDDLAAIANCSSMLKKDGKLTILVPAYQRLYNRFDRELGHFRRYNTKELTALFTKNGLTVSHRQYFNAAGILGWFVSGSLLKKEQIPSGQMKLYNRLVPLFKLVDNVLFNRFGLSVIVSGTK